MESKCKKCGLIHKHKIGTSFAWSDLKLVVAFCTNCKIETIQEL
jgi:hypothetical protein